VNALDPALVAVDAEQRGSCSPHEGMIVKRRICRIAESAPLP
jgi:hypothetical protein